MKYEDKIALAVQMANFRIEASQNSNGEIIELLPKTKKLSEVDKAPLSEDLYGKIIIRMLEFINEQESLCKD